MRALQYTIVLALSISLLAGFTPHAFAGIGGTTEGCELNEIDNFGAPPGASPPPDPEQPEQCIPNTGGGPSTWVIDFVTISFVPGAGPWVKALDVPPDLVFDILMEDIEVGAGPDWTDLHEEIQTPDWVFTDVTIVTNTGELHIIPGPTTYVWVDFDNPLPPGTLIGIQKSLSYIGDPILGSSIIVIWEYPTIDETGIGGETIPIDTAALLLAGAQSNAFSILGGLSVLGAAVFGAIFLLNRRK